MVIGMQRLEIYSASPFIHDGAVKAAWGGCTVLPEMKGEDGYGKKARNRP